MFYLPCQAQNPNESFFEEYNEGRTPLDPAEWIENSVFDFDSFEDWETENETEGREPDLFQIEAAKAAWRATPESAGNDAFFTLAINLRKACIADSDISATLYEEAGYARNPNERRNQISGIMKYLARRGVPIETLE